MFQDVYYQYNPWWEGTPKYEGLIERPHYAHDLERHLSDDTVVLLTGLRRVGKTTIMKLFIKKLLEKGIPPQHIFYVSLDDYSLDKSSIIDIVSDYRKLHKLGLDEKVHLFLDEVTYKDRFHQQLKNLHDKQGVKVYASSSSSSVLKDKRAFLTGRETVIEVSPLDFDEYLTFKHLAIKKSEAYLEEPYFDEYLTTGGMPEYVLNQDRGYLMTLVDDIISKDIVAFHSIKNVQHVKDFFRLVMERTGKPVSINALAKILRISVDTARRYLHMFEDTYLIHTVARSAKLNENIQAPKKMYAGDIGIRTLFVGPRGTGALFENYVYLMIRQFEPRYVYQDNNEIDFYTQNDVLVEAKYGSEMSEGQKELFEKFPAAHKMVVKSIHDIDELRELLAEISGQTQGVTL